MTVKELIEELQKLPQQDMEVKAWDEDTQSYEDIDGCVIENDPAEPAVNFVVITVEVD